MNKKEALQSIRDKFSNRYRTKGKKKKVVLAEYKEESKKEIKVNEGSFTANKDIREQIWDYLNIK